MGPLGSRGNPWRDSCAFHLQMPGPPSAHGAQKGRGLLPWLPGPHRTVSRRRGLEGFTVGFTVSSPPTALAACEDSASMALLRLHAQPSPGLFTNEAGVARGWGKGREGAHGSRSLCANGALSAGCGRECWDPGEPLCAPVTAQGLHLFEGRPGAQPPPCPLQASRHKSLWVSSDLRASLGQAKPRWTLGAAASPLWGLRPSLTQASWRGMQ